jgi:acetyl esterase
MEIDPQVHKVVEAVKHISPEVYEEVGAERAREAFDRVAVARRKRYGDEPVKAVDDLRIPGPAGELPVRVYTPDAECPLPLLVFLHGGGWSVGNLDSYDSQSRRICNEIGAVTVAVEYRLAPEHPYPAAFEDAVATLRWAAEHAEQLGGDGARLGVIGDSAGGNLAAAATLWARAHGGPEITGQCLLYPGTNSTRAYPSLDEFADGPLLTRATTLWFGDNYLPDFERRFEPYASPLLAERHDGLPPAVIATAGHDPIRDQGEAYADALEAAGVPVWRRRYEGMVHGFFAQSLVVDAAARAVEEICAAFRSILEGHKP